MKTFKTFLGGFILITFLSGCSAKQVNAPDENDPLKNTTSGQTKQVSPQADFIIGFHPFKDDPDNPSPHNPLVRKFGDIPEVRTYIRLKQKLRYGQGLNIDEAIKLYTAEYYLYPSDSTRSNLKKWKQDKERYIRLGVDLDGPVLRDSRDPIVNPSAEEGTDTTSGD